MAGRTAGATSWLGAGTRRRKRKPKSFDKTNWTFSRVNQFKQAVRFAAAARATRLALNVTQAEVAEYFGYNQSAVCYWESGKYFGWDAHGLAVYQEACRKLA